jgi:hypothetical protein
LAGGNGWRSCEIIGWGQRLVITRLIPNVAHTHGGQQGRRQGELTMAKARMQKIAWLSEQEAHDYPAAESYLSLIFNGEQVARMITQLRHAPIVQFKAKDIFRASQLSLLGVSNSHIEKDWAKIRKGQKLSPSSWSGIRRTAKW